jgi:hypothetical protein
MHSYGATGVYKFDLGETKNTFAFGAAAWGEQFISHSKLETTPSFIGYPVQEGIDIQTPFAPPDDLHDVTTGNGWTHEDSSNDFYFANWQMSALGDRLTTNIGVNHTKFKLLQWANGQATVPNETIDSQTSPLFGAVFDITQNISVFGVYATSLFPDTGKDSLELSSRLSKARASKAGSSSTAATTSGAEHSASSRSRNQAAPRIIRTRRTHRACSATWMPAANRNPRGSRLT